MRYHRSFLWIVWVILMFLLAGPVLAQSPGDLDPTFDGDGKVTTDLRLSDEFIWALVVQPDGKVVVAGYNTDFIILARYNTDGSLDPTFDGDGQVITGRETNIDYVTALALQPDGKI